MNIHDPGLCRIGPPLPGMQIKLVDVEEMGYSSNDAPNPRVEVWLWGPNVATLGYYKSPQKTAEDFVDGWFKTGDVGQWTSDGALEIFDRVKNLVKLSNGEYIALENLESKFRSSPLIDMICVYADSTQPFVVALVVPVRNRLTEWAHEHGIPEADNFEELCKNRKARDAVLASLVSVGKACKMKSFELPRDVYLCPEEWTPQNGMLTAAMKLKRAPVNARFKREIEEMYASHKE